MFLALIIAFQALAHFGIEVPKHVSHLFSAISCPSIATGNFYPDEDYQRQLLHWIWTEGHTVEIEAANALLVPTLEHILRDTQALMNNPPFLSTAEEEFADLTRNQGNTSTSLRWGLSLKQISLAYERSLTIHYSSAMELEREVKQELQLPTAITFEKINHYSSKLANLGRFSLFEESLLRELNPDDPQPNPMIQPRTASGWTPLSVRTMNSLAYLLPVGEIASGLSNPDGNFKTPVKNLNHDRIHGYLLQRSLERLHQARWLLTAAKRRDLDINNASPLKLALIARMFDLFWYELAHQRLENPVDKKLLEVCFFYYWHEVAKVNLGFKIFLNKLNSKKFSFRDYLMDRMRNSLDLGDETTVQMSDQEFLQGFKIIRSVYNKALISLPPTPDWLK